MRAINAVSTGKKTKGTKRQIATDTLGCLLAVVVHRANLVDTTMGIWPAMVASCAYPTSGFAPTKVIAALSFMTCLAELPR